MIRHMKELPYDRNEDIHTVNLEDKAWWMYTKEIIV